MSEEIKVKGPASYFPSIDKEVWPADQLLAVGTQYDEGKEAHGNGRRAQIGIQHGSRACQRPGCALSFTE